MRRGPRTLPRGAMFAAVLLLTIALGSGVPASAGMAGRMLHLINNARRHRGEHELQMDHGLSHAAHHHSVEMARRNYLFHTGNIAAELGNRPWSVWGENIAKVRGVKATFHAWMMSSEHRANILNGRFRHLGIGIYAKGRYLWSTADFWG